MDVHRRIAGGPIGHTSFLNDYVVLEGDVILDANVRTFGFVRVRNAHVVAGLSVSVWSGNLFLSNGNNYVAPAIWGAGTLVPYQNAAVLNVTGDTYVNNAKCALALTSNLLTTGTQFTAGTPGSWTSGVSLTAANLDTAPIQDPGSGARFC